MRDRLIALIEKFLQRIDHDEGSVANILGLFRRNCAGNRASLWHADFADGRRLGGH